MLADALATAFLVMGSKAVTGILEHHTDAQILLVDNKLRLMVTEGLLPHLQPVGENKELIILEDYTNGYTHKT
jgi:thiamine biosynthesis lipoprotein ApbE